MKNTCNLLMNECVRAEGRCSYPDLIRFGLSAVVAAAAAAADRSNAFIEVFP